MPDELPPVPRRTPPPYANGAMEPKSGLFTVHTGRTRRYVIWTAIIGGIVTLLSPIMNALAQRLLPAPPIAVREPLFPPRDGGQ